MSKNFEKPISKSPDSGSFAKERYGKQLEENPAEETATGMIDWYEKWEFEQAERELTAEWRKDNMEYDLRSTNWICDKVKESDVYAQHLYAAMCNRDFQKLDVMPILKDQRWSCSWRHAGGIIADMQEKGDYIDWYCSGIRDQTPLDQEEWNFLTYEQQVAYKEGQAYVGEGVATDEIREDLNKLGWAVLDDE